MPYGYANNYKHGHTAGETTTEYTIWQMMKDRCLNPNAPNYHRYGGRGITIDPTWMDFKQFLKDMGKRPASNLTLHRIHNDLGYSKGNCKWATPKEQAHTRSDNKLTQSDIDYILLHPKISCRAMGALFNVGFQHISKIRRGERW